MQHGRAGLNLDVPLLSLASLLGLSLASLLGFTSTGCFLMAVVQRRSVRAALRGVQPLTLQVFVGAICGLAMSLCLVWLTHRPYMASVRLKYVQLCSQLQKPSDIILVALCAGVGEELLIRGAIQHWLGIPFTAIGFTLVHGYFDPYNKHMMLLGTVMFLGSMVFGYTAKSAGLLAVMVAHAVYDIVVIVDLCRTS